MATDSFQIEYPAPNGPPVVGATNAAANPPVGSRPVVPAPGPGNWRDYYVLVNGLEPKDCHMVIRWKAAVTIGMRLPQAAETYCIGDCPKIYKGCGKDILMNPIPALRMVVYCTCQLPPLAIRREFNKVILESKARGKAGGGVRRKGRKSA